MKSLSLLLILFAIVLSSFGQKVVNGNAFLDKNSNGIKDKGEKSFKGLKISNGRDIVNTDKNGNYTIEKLEGRFIFAIKPSNYSFALDKEYQPQFYQKEDSEIFDIPMCEAKEDDKFSIVLMGDIQVYGQDQLNFFGQVATDELRDAEYEFLIALGDIVGNNLPEMPNVKKVLGLAQKPNYYVIGNHDRDRGDFEDPTILDNDSYEKSFGPDYYSFDRGNVHFLVLNNVLTIEQPVGKGSDYRPGIHPMQVEFIKNDLKHVSSDKLVVVCAHIPFFNELKKIGQTATLISVLENHPNVFLATGHAHNNIQSYLGEKEGRKGKRIHQLVAGAIGGGWWRGERDIWGVPGSMMKDGSPQGYWFMHIDGPDYQLEYKASRRPIEKQMHIWVPYFNVEDTVMSSEVNDRDVWVNVYAGNEETEVELRIDEGEWQIIDRREDYDPYVLRLLKRQHIGRTPTHGSRPLKDEARICSHLWYYQLPEAIDKGAHIIEVRALNNYGLDAKANRVFWCK